MKKYTFLTITVSCIFALCTSIRLNAQLANHNTILLSNLNQHPVSNTYKYSACWGYTAPNGREYAILGCYAGTSFVDITDTTNIHEVGFLPPTNPLSSYNEWREMKVYSHYAYIVSEVSNSGVQIVDLQYLPDSIHYLGQYLFSGYGNTHSIQQSGPYLYLNGGNYQNGGVFILDLTSNPVSPVKRGQWETYYVHDCRVRNDTIWACNIYYPPGTITVINGTNKDNLTTITSWVNNPNPFPHNCALTIDYKYLYTTDETQSPPGKLKVWDVQNLSNVQLITSWQPTGITTAIVHNVEIYGNYAVVAHYEAGIRILDISNPTVPTEVAWYDTYPSGDIAQYYGCWGVFMFPSGKIIGSDTQTGLYVIRTTFNITGTINNRKDLPVSYALKQNYPNPFNPTTKIEYNLPKDGYVVLKVYDISGKQVGLLADGYERAGNHLINYDASRLSSGVYFYRISVNGFSDTKKMILVK